MIWKWLNDSNFLLHLIGYIVNPDFLVHELDYKHDPFAKSSFSNYSFFNAFSAYYEYIRP